jgi:hypothetical protein
VTESYLRQALAVLGYSAQSLDLGRSPNSIARHLHSEVNRLRQLSDAGSVFLSYEVPLRGILDDAQYRQLIKA